MSEHTYPNIPEYVTDHLGQKVYPGDFIVYAVRAGNTGAMESGTVLSFQFPKQQSYSSWANTNNVLKIKVQGPHADRRPSLIEEVHKRFAKVARPEEPVLDSEQ